MRSTPPDFFTPLLASHQPFRSVRADLSPFRGPVRLNGVLRIRIGTEIMISDADEGTPIDPTRGFPRWVRQPRFP